MNPSIWPKVYHCPRCGGASNGSLCIPCLSRDIERDRTMTACERCQGNGEIVTDWNRYRSPLPEDAGDEAVAECPDCGGTGRVDSTPFPITA